MTEIASIAISLFAVLLSGVTAWLTLLRRGTIRMTRPTLVFFGPDGAGGTPKVYLRTLLYSTAKQRQIIENMYAKIRRDESVQTFNVWVYGDEWLARGSGLYVGEGGVTCNHHFLLPRDGTHFEFLAGEYFVEVYATLVRHKKPLLLSHTNLLLDDNLVATMKEKGAGVFFDWEPDSAKYYAHVDKPGNPMRGKLSA